MYCVKIGFDPTSEVQNTESRVFQNAPFANTPFSKRALQLPLGTFYFEVQILQSLSTKMYVTAVLFMDAPDGKREMMDIIIIILGFSQAWSLSADSAAVYISTAVYYIQPARG